ncbi:DUF3263 domain-containing protein [uncultured Microbacterium sp.]|uniref:DUF3263 domain-containing protein n=1 Tax=uncultured Microbacterium sp. TaxID=191216 RepID=UPI0035CB62CD
MPSTDPAETTDELSARERAILDFEAAWSRHVGAKEEAIRAELGLTPARYYQLLGRLLDSAAAVVYDPMLVKRLRRIRDSREQARLARSSAAR